MANEVCSQSNFDLIQSFDGFQKRSHSFAEEGTCKKKLATSPSSSSTADRQASLSASDLMPSCQGFQKHGYKFPTTHISPRLLYTTVAESCPSDDGSATAKDSNSHNLNIGNNLENMLDCDDFLPLEDDSADKLTHDDGIGIAQRVGPVEYIKRLLLKRSALSISSAELGVNTKLSMMPESSRDLRHTGDLCWHEYYHMSDVSQTVLPPKRYTRCEPLTGVRCFHEPWAMLQVFSIKLKAYLQDIGISVEVYGFIAIRDAEDYRRNYLFNRSRADPVTINTLIFWLFVLSIARVHSLEAEAYIFHVQQRRREYMLHYSHISLPNVPNKQYPLCIFLFKWREEGERRSGYKKGSLTEEGRHAGKKKRLQRKVKIAELKQTCKATDCMISSERSIRCSSALRFCDFQELPTKLFNNAEEESMPSAVKRITFLVVFYMWRRADLGLAALLWGKMSIVRRYRSGRYVYS